jgi:hypothetical protein
VNFLPSTCNIRHLTLNMLPSTFSSRHLTLDFLPSTFYPHPRLFTLALDFLRVSVKAGTPPGTPPGTPGTPPGTPGIPPGTRWDTSYSNLHPSTNVPQTFSRVCLPLETEMFHRSCDVSHWKALSYFWRNCHVLMCLRARFNISKPIIIRAIFKSRNGESRNGTERNRGMERNGTRKAGIFKTRNEKSRNL